MDASAGWNGFARGVAGCGAAVAAPSGLLRSAANRTSDASTSAMVAIVAHSAGVRRGRIAGVSAASAGCCSPDFADGGRDRGPGHAICPKGNASGC